MAKLIRFDWAMKKLLRNKANFEILEGFISELLKDDIKIQRILESESNKEHKSDKFNRVDLIAETSSGEIIIIEVQVENEIDFLQRMLYATSKAVTEHLSTGDSYLNVKKIYSINILYFDLGQGKDYVYHGTTSFKGIHFDDELTLSSRQIEVFDKDKPHELYPEYYILKVNQFNDIAKDTLDEWIHFLKTEEIGDKVKAKGLKKAKKVLDVMMMSEEEQQEYKGYLEDMRYQSSMHFSSYGVGKIDGIKEGEKIGIEKGEKMGIEKGEKIGIEKGEKIGIEKGRKEGEQLGIEKGRKEERNLLISQLLKSGMSKENLSVMLGISIVELDEIIENLLN